MKNQMQEERSEICKAIEEFADKMKKKMLDKQKEGWFGWNDNNFAQVIRDRMIVHIGRFLALDEGEYVDIANFCMMLDRFNDLP